MPPDAFEQLLRDSHVGLNCQRLFAPISGVTFPSKVFTYLSAGLMVISSKAGAVERVCGNSCLYFDGETPQALASTMREVIGNYIDAGKRLALSAVHPRYSLSTTAARLRQMLKIIGVVEPG
jgi:hypothetical protein